MISMGPRREVTNRSMSSSTMDMLFSICAPDFNNPTRTSGLNASSGSTTYLMFVTTEWMNRSRMTLGIAVRKRRKKYTLFLFALVMLCLCVGCVATPEKKVLRKIPRGERSDLVVLNFKNNSAGSGVEKFQPWELGLASMMMTDLETIGQFNLISSKEVLEKEY